MRLSSTWSCFFSFVLQQIQHATQPNEVTNELREVLLKGRLDDKQHLPGVLVPYFYIRDDMTIRDRLIFKRGRVFISRQLKSEMEQAIHSSHIGIDG